MVTLGRLASRDSVKYAMGLQFDIYRGLPIVRHGGSYGGYRAEFSRVLSARMTIAILCNIRTAVPYVLKNRILDVYLGDRLAALTPAALSAPGPAFVEPVASSFLRDLADFTGSYFSAELDVRWTVLPSATNGIALQRRNLVSAALTSRDTTNTRFTIVGAPVELRFERDVSGRVTGFILDSGDIIGVRFVKLK